MSTTSGRVRAAASTAARPSAAWPATRNPASLSSSAVSPSRTRSWSSTTSTVISGFSLHVTPPSGSWPGPRSASRRVRVRRSSRPPSVCDAAAHPGDAEPVGVRPVGPGARSWLATRSRTAPGRYPTSTTACGCAECLTHVGQRLLEHPVGGEVHRGRQRPARRRSPSASTVTPASVTRATRSSSAGEPGRRCAGLRRVVLVGRDRGERGAQLGERLRAGPADRLERLARLRRPGAAEVQRDVGLHLDRGETVADHVVHLLREPQPLGVERAAGPTRRAPGRRPRPPAGGPAPSVNGMATQATAGSSPAGARQGGGVGQQVGRQQGERAERTRAPRAAVGVARATAYTAIARENITGP